MDEWVGVCSNGGGGGKHGLREQVHEFMGVARATPDTHVGHDDLLCSFRRAPRVGAEELQYIQLVKIMEGITLSIRMIDGDGL
ncbi:hypothetical protein Tco_0456350 [Tanacetum coccineum]